MFRSSRPLLFNASINCPIIVDGVPDCDWGVCGGLFDGGRGILFLWRTNGELIGSGDGSDVGYEGDISVGDILWKRNASLSDGFSALEMVLPQLYTELVNKHMVAYGEEDTGLFQMACAMYLNLYVWIRMGRYMAAGVVGVAGRLGNCKGQSPI